MTFLGWLSDPFKGLSDLQLGDQKVTLNHLEGNLFFNPSSSMTFSLEVQPATYFYRSEVPSFSITLVGICFYSSNQ